MRRSELKRCREAARILLKMQLLQKSINNRGDFSDLWKPILYLKWKDESKEGFVFSPEKENGVTVGRDSSFNDICIHQEKVSKQHCRFFYVQNRLYLQDLGSMNGTWYKKGFRWHQVNDYIEITKRTKIRVGDLIITAELFMYSLNAV